MPNSLYTGTASDWANMFKEYSTTEGGISLWEQALTSLQQTADIQAQAVQATADYDISQAYANYLQSQRQISQASNLGTGFKEQLESNLQSSYQSAFGQAETEEAQGLYNIAQQYSENVTETENQFAEVGSALSSIDEQKINYLQTYGQYIPGYDNINWSGDLVEQGIYDLDANNNLVLTEKGSNIMSYALLNRISIPGETPEEASSISFEEYLKLNSEDDYNNYLQYYDIYRNAFGIAPGTVGFDQEQFEENRLEEWRKNFEAVVPEELSEYYSGLDMTEEEYRNLTDKYTNIQDFYGVAEDMTSTKLTVSGKEYKIYSVVNRAFPSGEYGVDDYAELNRKYENSGLETGDVVEYMGARFVVTGKQGKFYDFAQITSGEEREKNLAEEGYKRKYNSMWHRNEWVKI